MKDLDEIRASIKKYYASSLQKTADLKTGACCCSDGLEPDYREILSHIHPEILEKFYGCGSPLPPALEGLTILDLGCGTGRDVYLASNLVGPQGRVIGIDMTDSQLEIARRHKEHHRQKFGYSESNVHFHECLIEDLLSAGIGDESVDLVISNCVINLSPDKKSVFSEALRVLRPGGEIYFADVFADRRVSDEASEDPVVRGECLGGAMYIEDFRRLLLDLGVRDYRVVSSRPIRLDDPDILAKTGSIGFMSATVRAFKLFSLEDRCEDYGQVAYYLGTIPGHPHSFTLDDHHAFYTGRPMLVCGNTAEMLTNTRFGAHFTVSGDRSVHYGLFQCGEPAGNDCGC